VFYLPTQIAAQQGEEVCGVLTCAPNKGNARDLDIQLKIDFDGESCSVHTDTAYRLR
jgi:hypothetical protein